MQSNLLELDQVTVNSETKIQQTNISNQESEPLTQKLTNLNRKQYITKIRILETEVSELKSQLQYKQQAHQRQIENIKVFMQFELEEKIQKLKTKLREQYHTLFIQVEKYENQKKYKSQQTSVFEQKAKRLEKYCQQLEREREQRIKLNEEEVQRLKQEKQDLLCAKNNEIEALKADLKVESKRKEDSIRFDMKFLEKKIENMEKDNVSLLNSLKEFKQQNQHLRVQNEEFKIIKGRELNELRVKLDVYRDQSASSYLQQTRLLRKQSQQERVYKENVEKLSYTQNLQRQIKLQHQKAVELQEKCFNECMTTKKQKKNRVFGNIKRLRVRDEDLGPIKSYTQQNSPHIKTIQTCFEEFQTANSQIESPKFVVREDQ